MFNHPIEVHYLSVTRGKSNHTEEPTQGTFWRCTAIDIDTRLRVGRAIGKNEKEVATVMMKQIRDRCNPIEPPAISSDESFMRLSVSILIDINEEWMTTKRYLSMDLD